MTRTIELDCGHTFKYNAKTRRPAKMFYVCKNCKRRCYAKRVKEGSIYVR